MQFEFTCDPVTILLTLEKEGFLQDEISEVSPLRRLDSLFKKKMRLPIVFDTRQLDQFPVSKGPSYVFVARSGKSFDAHCAIEKVIQAGNIFVGEKKKIVTFLKKSGRPQAWIKEVLSHPYLVTVTHANKTLWRMLEASTGVSSEELTSFAVTGTNGKTSIVDIQSQLISLLSQQKNLTLGTLGIKVDGELYPNSHPTMTDYPAFLHFANIAKTKKIQNVIFEATSQGLDQDRLGNWQVDVAFFTNLTPDHLDYHKTLDKYFDAKAILFKKHLKKRAILVVNADDERALEVCELGALSTRRLILVGFNEPPEFLAKISKQYADVKYLKVSEIKMTSKELSGKWELTRYLSNKEEENKNFSTPLMGKYQAHNLSMCAASMLMLGYPLKDVLKCIAKLKPIPGRFERVSLSQPVATPTVVVDYAHSPDALLKLLSNCREATDGKVICVFGCGGDRDRTKRPVMGKIASEHAHHVVITSDNPRSEEPNEIISEIRGGISQQCLAQIDVEVDRNQAIHKAISLASPQDLVVIAGKGHENTQEIRGEKKPFSDTDVAKKALEALFLK